MGGFVQLFTHMMQLFPATFAHCRCNFPQSSLLRCSATQTCPGHYG